MTSARGAASECRSSSVVGVFHRHDLPVSVSSEALICRRCGRAVGASDSQYETFEQMHYVCFHYAFEHDPMDPDEVCRAGGCPSGAVAGGRDRVAGVVRSLADDAREGVTWANDSLPRYLEALATWLTDADGFYVNDHRVPPSNAWEAIEDAFKAATVYE